jgi:nitrous oxidase accessory protein NosD
MTSIQRILRVAVTAAMAVSLVAFTAGAASAAVVCYPTGFNGLDAAQLGGDVSGTLDATGCNIGVYYDSTTLPGNVTPGSEIFGATYYGVLVNGTSVNVTGSSVHDIGETPLNGVQHGNAIVYLSGASGTISGNTVSHYQKNGITVRDAGSSASVVNNVVTGEGPVTYIAQNGIQISYGATATVMGNTVSGNDYTPKAYVACGLLLYQASGVKVSGNTLFANEKNMCNFGKGGGNVTP